MSIDASPIPYDRPDSGLDIHKAHRPSVTVRNHSDHGTRYYAYCSTCRSWSISEVWEELQNAARHHAVHGDGSWR